MSRFAMETISQDLSPLAYQSNVCNSDMNGGLNVIGTMLHERLIVTVISLTTTAGGRTLIEKFYLSGKYYLSFRILFLYK